MTTTLLAIISDLPCPPSVVSRTVALLFLCTLSTRRFSPLSPPLAAHSLPFLSTLSHSFRFIVSKSGEYAENIIDPDAVIDWELVEFVLCPQSDDVETTCCICLESPTCPRIAKCGHLFCWSCILQLFSYHEQTSLAPCPVCLREKIRIIDLRPVILEKFAPAKVGRVLDLVLLQRPKHLNLVYPTTMSPHLDSKKPLPYYEEEHEAQFNRLLVTNRLLDLFTTESLQLEAAIASAKSSQDLTLYMEVAQQILKAEMAEMETKAEGLAYSSSSLASSSSQLLAPIAKPAPKQRLSDFMPEQLEAGNCFFFYQSRDGQLIFLHPLNMHYLMEEYGGDVKMPDSLEKLPIMDLETKTFDEKTRRKFPALAHLPISCQFQFVLVDISGLLTQPIAKASFMEDVKKRQNAIQRANEMEAKRAEVHSQQYAAKQLKLMQAQAIVNRRHQQSVVGSGAMELLPPDLNEHFPEINAIALSSSPSTSPSPYITSPYSAASPATSSSPRPVTAWEKGSLIQTIHKASEEEAFPALFTHKDKNGDLILSEESRAVLSSTSSTTSTSSTSTPSAATSTTSTSRAPLNFSAAVSSGSQNAGTSGTTPAANAKGKKKQGKKTILVI